MAFRLPPPNGGLVVLKIGFSIIVKVFAGDFKSYICDCVLVPVWQANCFCSFTDVAGIPP